MIEKSMIQLPSPTVHGSTHGTMHAPVARQRLDLPGWGQLVNVALLSLMRRV